jgi:hypothetical protein
VEISFHYDKKDRNYPIQVADFCAIWVCPSNAAPLASRYASGAVTRALVFSRKKSRQSLLPDTFLSGSQAFITNDTNGFLLALT